MDNGGVVDASGTMTLDGKAITYKDARDVVQALANSDTIRNCFTTQWARFAFKRHETDDDQFSLDSMAGAFGKDGAFNVKELMVGVVGSRSFRYRLPAAGEVLR
jgi:hypothetical protein